MGRRLRNDLPMIDSLFQPASVKQKDVSRYLKKTKKDQTKHHDRHASSKMKELQPRTKVWMQPWTDSRGWKPETVVRHHHTLGSYLIQVENRRKNRRNRHSYKFAHLQDMKFKCRTVSCYKCTSEPTQGRAWPCSSSTSVACNFTTAATPCTWITKADSSEPYVTWSGDWTFRPN